MTGQVAGAVHRNNPNDEVVKEEEEFRDSEQGQTAT